MVKNIWTIAIKNLKKQEKYDDDPKYKTDICNMKHTQTIDYTKWLNKPLAAGKTKECLANLTGHALEVTDNKITEFVGDSNGAHYLYAYTHDSLLQLVKKAEAAVTA